MRSFFTYFCDINPLSLSKNTDRSPPNLSLVLQKQVNDPLKNASRLSVSFLQRQKDLQLRLPSALILLASKFMIKVRITENESASPSRKDQSRRSKHDKLLMRCRIHQILSLSHQKYEKTFRQKPCKSLLFSYHLPRTSHHLNRTY